MAFLEIEGLGKIHYHEYGSGDQLLFAFHGYGMTGKQFDVLENSLMKRYRIIGFDHFFHGKSTLFEGKEAFILAGMKPDLLNSYINSWFKKFGKTRFSLMGYSMGANMALYLVENFAELVDEVFLMAPDGLVPNKSLDFLRASFIGKKIFRKLTYNYWMMAWTLKLLKKLRVIDQELYDIASNEVTTLQKRLDAYFTVNFIKNIRPDIEHIATLINQNHIRCRLYFGKHDHLFPQGNGKKLLALLHRPELHVVHSGHWIVTSELDNYIEKQTA